MLKQRASMAALGAADDFGGVDKNVERAASLKAEERLRVEAGLRGDWASLAIFGVTAANATARLGRRAAPLMGSNPHGLKPSSQ